MKIQQERRIRSMLYVPGHRPELFEKAWRSEADAVVVDLEDAVPPLEKVQARERLDEFVGERGIGNRLFVRVNGFGSPWSREDIEKASAIGAAGIRLPKCVSGSEVLEASRIASRVGEVGGSVFAIVPTLESSQALIAAVEVAAPDVVPFIGVGFADLRRELRMTVGPDELEYLGIRTAVVVASRAAGCAGPMDSVFLNVKDREGFRSSAERAQRLGFQGKSLIHPNQVSVANEVFYPTLEEEDWARKVLKSAESARKESQSRKGIVVDGGFVDPPVAAIAQAIVAEVEARPRRG